MRNAHLVALFLATFPPFLSIRGAGHPSNLAPNWSGTLQENNVVDTVNTQKNESYTSKEASTTSSSSRKHHLGTAHVVGHSTVHQLKYAPQIVSLVGERQLQGTASSLNEAVAASRVAVSPGQDFGASYEGFFRINVALPERDLMRAIERLCKAITALAPDSADAHSRVVATTRKD